MPLSWAVAITTVIVLLNSLAPQFFSSPDSLDGAFAS